MNAFNYLFRRAMPVVFWLSVIASFLYFSYFWFFFYPNTRNINVFTWAGMIDTQYVSRFEKEAGVTVTFSYYESNEELLVKLRATRGEGYDLIVPGDYAVNILKKEGLLKKINTSQLSFIKNINPLLLGHYYDPKNEYSLPAEWAVFGLGIDTHTICKKDAVSWKLAFEPEPGRHVIMINDPLVAIPLALLYLYGTLDTITVDKLNQVKSLLIKQKSHIMAYSDFRPDYYLASRNVPIAVASSAYIWRSMNNYEYIDFVIPQEGSLITIENYAIPVSSKKEQLVYQFLEFLMRPETVKHHFYSEAATFPVTIDVLDQLKLKEAVKSLLLISPDEFKKFHFLRIDELTPPINEQFMQELWINIKS